jgi:hypothetical protein
MGAQDVRGGRIRDRVERATIVHVISAYVAQCAALSEENARRVLGPGILRAADPGLREHELYAWYYDRVDQPAVAHEATNSCPPGALPRVGGGVHLTRIASAAGFDGIPGVERITS